MLKSEPITRRGFGVTAVGVFLIWGAAMASLAGFTLTWQGTMLDQVWALNPHAYLSLEPIGSTVGPLFLVLSAALLATGIGWFRRLRWAWKLALVIIANSDRGRSHEFVLWADR